MTRDAVVMTLVTAGFAILRVRSIPVGIEFLCERKDVLGGTVRYLLAFRPNEPAAEDLEALRRVTHQEQAVLAVITDTPSDKCIDWAQFAMAVGGEVPSWRALTPDFPQTLRTLSFNTLPVGEKGQAWELFEHAVADSLEFLFGRRVRRFGGLQRGRTVSDMVAVTPDERILVVDTKASGTPYSLGEPELRPLREYADRQRIRQYGQVDVAAVLLVSNGFQQDSERLTALSGMLIADARLPLAFLSVDVLVHMLSQLLTRPHLRNAIRWGRLLCVGGPVSARAFDEECAAAQAERVRRDE